MDTLLFEKAYCQHPWAGTENFIDPFAMLDYLRPLNFVHHNLALLLDGFLVA